MRGGCNLVSLRSPLCSVTVWDAALSSWRSEYFGWVSVVPFSFISHWRWFQISSRADKVTRCICWSLASLIVAFPIVWFMCGVQMRAMITGLRGGECSLDVCGRRTRGVNGRFIYHRCHSPPERKSALPNWNIAEFTLLIRALSAVLSPRLSSNWEQRRSDT